MSDCPVDYVLIGHMTADLLPDGGRSAGGTVAYSACTAHAFGLRVGVVTACAGGEPLLESLTPYASVIALESDTTTTYENQYTPHGRDQFVRGVARDITPDDIPPAWRCAPLVHVAPIAGEARAAGLMSLFPQARKLITVQGWLRAWSASGKVSFAPLSEPSALSAFDLAVFSIEDVRGDLAQVDAMTHHAPYTVMTRADAGGTVYPQNGQAWHYTSPTVEALDPTGAGDIFATSLLCAWQKLGDFERALTLAARLAAESVTRRGIDSAPTAESVGL